MLDDNGRLVHHVAVFSDVSRLKAHAEELDRIAALTFKVNEELKAFFLSVGVILVDFKIEFGRCPALGNQIILADEISPDTCRLWDAKTHEKLDKDRFRRDMGDVIEGYTEVARRLGIMKEMPTVIQGGLH